MPFALTVCPKYSTDRQIKAHLDMLLQVFEYLFEGGHVFEGGQMLLVFVTGNQRIINVHSNIWYSLEHGT